MELTNRDVFGFTRPLQELSTKELSIKTSYRILKIVKQIETQLSIIEKMRVDLVKKHGGADEKGNVNISPGSDAFNAFIIDFNEVLEQPVSINIEPVPLPDTLEISASSLLALEKIILFNLI